MLVNGIKYPTVIICTLVKSQTMLQWSLSAMDIKVRESGGMVIGIVLAPAH